MCISGKYLSYLLRDADGVMSETRSMFSEGCKGHISPYRAAGAPSNDIRHRAHNLITAGNETASRCESTIRKGQGQGRTAKAGTRFYHV